MRNFIANCISIILIPFFAPTYLFCIILFYFPNLTSIATLNFKLEAIAYIFISTTLLPLIFIFLLFKLKKIKTLTLDDKKDRTLPQLFSCLNYLLVSLFLIYKLGINDALTLCIFASTISLISITIITYFWKISAHTSGISGILAIVMVLYFKYNSNSFLFPCIIIGCLTFAVCMARLHLKVHTPLQIIYGCLLGSSIGFLLFFFSNIPLNN